MSTFVKTTIDKLKRLSKVKFLSTFIFLFTYLVLNPILYLHFGHTYLIKFENGAPVYSPVENDLLVYITSWFSFAEEIESFNTPVLDAMTISVFSVNFILPLVIILIADVVYAFRPFFLVFRPIRKVQVDMNPAKVYFLSVCASYVVNGVYWIKNGYPGTGISIVGFCFSLSYTIAWILQYFKFERINNMKHSRLRRSFFYGVTSFFIIIFCVGPYVYDNPYAGTHLMGFMIFLALSLILLLVTLIQESKKSQKESG